MTNKISGKIVRKELNIYSNYETTVLVPKKTEIVHKEYIPKNIFEYIKFRIYEMLNKDCSINMRRCKVTSREVEHNDAYDVDIKVPVNIRVVITKGGNNTDKDGYHYDIYQEEQLDPIIVVSEDK